MRAIWNHLGGFGKLLMTIMLVFASFIGFTFLALLAALPFTDGLFLAGTEGMPLSVNMLRYFQIVQSFSVFIIPSLLAGLFFWGHLTRGIGFRRPATGLLLMSLAIIVSSQPLVSYLGILNNNMQLPEFLRGLELWMKQSEDSSTDIIYSFLDTDRPGLLLINFIMIAILPALGEEMLFRGVLQPVFREWLKNKHVAVWLTAFLFSAIHLQFFTFLPRFFLGLALGYLMLLGKNLWYPVAGHFANNFMSLIIFYYYRYTNPDINPLQPGTEDLTTDWNFVLPSIALLGFLLWKFHKIRNAPEQTKNY